MISRTYHCIYIHQRKTAGSSIIGSFGLDAAQPDWHSYNDGVLSSEWPARSPEEKGYFVFSSIRNPFDRLVSAWKYLPATRKRSLEEVLHDPPREGHDYRHLTRPQIAILRASGASDLVAEEVIRFEHLQNDFDRVCDLIGKPRCRLAHENRGLRNSPWRPYFTATARKLAEEMFREDLEAFSYDF